MANVLSIKQRKTYQMHKGKKVPLPPPTAANLSHASAVRSASYWLNDGSGIMVSEKLSNTREVNQRWHEWENQARDLYRENHSRKRNPPSNTTLIEEMMVVVGTDVENDFDHRELMETYVKHFEEKYNTKVLYWAYHDHEGHIDFDTREEKINRHYHLFFSNISNHGKSVRRQWKRGELSQMQTDVHEVGTSIGMKIERAIKYEKGKAPKGKGHRSYRIEKQKEEREKVKRKIESLTTETLSLKESIQILKEENKQLRAALQAEKAKRTHYAQLESEKKRLDDLIRRKEIDHQEAIDQLKQVHASIIQELRDQNAMKDTIISQKEAQIVSQREEIAQLESAPVPAAAQEEIDRLKEMAYISMPASRKRPFRRVRRPAKEVAAERLDRLKRMRKEIDELKSMPPVEKVVEVESPSDGKLREKIVELENEMREMVRDMEERRREIETRNRELEGRMREMDTKLKAEQKRASTLSQIVKKVVKMLFPSRGSEPINDQDVYDRIEALLESKSTQKQPWEIIKENQIDDESEFFGKIARK